MNASQYLKEYREKHKLSLRQLEELTGVSIAYLHRLEKGSFNPSYNTLKKLNQTIQLPIDEFEGSGEDKLYEVKIVHDEANHQNNPTLHFDSLQKVQDFIKVCFQSGYKVEIRKVE